MTERRANPNSLKNLKPFQKGISGSPGGKTRLPDALRNHPELTKEMVRRVIGKYTSMAVEDIMDAQHNPRLPALEAAIASILIKTIETGDMAKLDMMLSRVHGKPKETPEESSNPFADLTTIEVVSVGETLLKTLKAETKDE